MLGTVTSNERQARETLRQIKAAGYDGLELNSFMVHPSSLMVRLMTRAAGMPTGSGGKLDWPALLQESGLGVVSLHTDLGSLERDPEAVLRDAERFGTKTLAITGMYRFDYSEEGSVRELARRLDAAGERVRQGGMRLLYHDHNVELLQVRPGLRAYDILIDETDPEKLGFEFDSFWFADGGADPAAWMRRLGRRMILWHVTDRGSRQHGPAMTPILKVDSVELGTGNMDLEGLWKIAEENGVEAVVLESHRNWIDGDVLKSIRRSAQWLRERK